MIKETLNTYLPWLKFGMENFDISGLPMIYRKNYQFRKLILDGQDHLGIYVISRDLGVRQFKKHSEVLAKKTGLPMIWCLASMEYHKVQRMIENGMNFVIENKQVHLPTIRVSIKPEKRPWGIVPTKLNSGAIDILIHQILKGDLTGKSKVEIARTCGRDQMNVVRALRILLGYKICYERNVGTSKHVYFEERSALWDFFKKKVETPVSGVVFLNCEVGAPLSGVSALAEQGMLADDDIKTVAMWKRDYFEEHTPEEHVDDEIAKTRVEVWSRKPILISGNTVNVLDLYLILKDEKDERVQIELETLLKKHGLQI